MQALHQYCNKIVKPEKYILQSKRELGGVLFRVVSWVSAR